MKKNEKETPSMKWVENASSAGKDQRVWILTLWPSRISAHAYKSTCIESSIYMYNNYISVGLRPQFSGCKWNLPKFYIYANESDKLRLQIN